MKCWVCESKGLENLKLIEKDIPAVTRDFDIKVKVLAAALNPVDVKKLNWEREKSQFPIEDGVDACSLVLELGS
jgi:hypothetical protein